MLYAAYHFDDVNCCELLFGMVLGMDVPGAVKKIVAANLFLVPLF